MNTYQRLKELILAQGIVTASAIHPNANLSHDLSYNLRDVAELTRMAEQHFGVQITLEEYSTFETVRDIVHFLNNRQIERDLTIPFSDYSSWAL